jgi:hypothetical protein
MGEVTCQACPMGASPCQGYVNMLCWLVHNVHCTCLVVAQLAHVPKAVPDPASHAIRQCMCRTGMFGTHSKNTTTVSR